MSQSFPDLIDDLNAAIGIKDGMSKAELLEKHNHVLGLNNVSLDIEAGLSVNAHKAVRGRESLFPIRHCSAPRTHRARPSPMPTKAPQI